MGERDRKKGNLVPILAVFFVCSLASGNGLGWLQPVGKRKAPRTEASEVRIDMVIS